MKKLAVYLHWPFCLSKCPYCDFASRPMPDGEDENRWAESFVREMEVYAQRLPEREVTSLYFGGGTPSLMSARTVERLIDKSAGCWRFAEDCEITLEANPTSSEEGKFRDFRAGGVNRLSLGVQSFDDSGLRFLGRTHDSAEACRALELAANVFDRFSFDLIYARAEQTCPMWERELDKALSFNPRHLSLYQLTLEEGSAFYKKRHRQTLVAAEELAEEMFDLTQEKMERAGLPAYEISNHAVSGQESRHNLAYWRYEDYIGIGPSAQGRFIDETGQRIASENDPHPARWLERGPSHEEKIDDITGMKEAVMMGLRLASGINTQMWNEKFSLSLQNFLRPERIKTLEREGLVAWSQKTFAATPEGRKKLNAVLAFLLS